MNEYLMVIGSSALCMLTIYCTCCLQRGVVIPKGTPLSDCTEAIIHITRPYSYHNHTDFTGKWQKIANGENRNSILGAFVCSGCILGASGYWLPGINKISYPILTERYIIC